MAINELGMLTVADDTLTERGATPAIPILDDEGIIIEFYFYFF